MFGNTVKMFVKIQRQKLSEERLHSLIVLAQDSSALEMRGSACLRKMNQPVFEKVGVC